jgi:hypothetical protein
MVKKVGSEATGGRSPHPAARRDLREDRHLERELRADEKERAEHVMLVDLGRNDLGRVCLPGTVKVADYMNVDRYSHVMHLVSTVTGQLKPSTTAFDLVRATFPAGTVSGAPKIRAMEIIEELEPHRRGPYAGMVVLRLWELRLGDLIRVLARKGGPTFRPAPASSRTRWRARVRSASTSPRARTRRRAGPGQLREWHDTAVDNYDSFTYNLAQYLQELGREVVVYRNDALGLDAIRAMKPEAIVISPGPGDPDQAGISLEVIRELAGKIPILGVASAQCIGQAFGGKIVRAKRSCGRTSRVRRPDALLGARLAARGRAPLPRHRPGHGPACLR